MLGRLEHLPVQQVVDFLVVQLEEGDINGDAAIARILCQALHQLACAPLDKTDLIHCHRLLYLRFVLAFLVLNVLVALHCERFTSSCLPVSEQGCVVAIDNLTNHSFDANLLVEGTLVHQSIANFVELKVLRLLVPSVILHGYHVSCAVDLRLAGGIRRCTPTHC